MGAFAKFAIFETRIFFLNETQPSGKNFNRFRFLFTVFIYTNVLWARSLNSQLSKPAFFLKRDATK